MYINRFAQLSTFAKLLALTLLTGCGPTTQTYVVSVKNESATPMTVWLTKDGPPAEGDWLSPEQIAIGGMPLDVPLAGTIIPPGQAREVGPIEGKFDSGTNAILRVYNGNLKFRELLGVGTTSLNRKDIRLSPGSNEITIDKAGQANNVPTK